MQPGPSIHGPILLPSGLHSVPDADGGVYVVTARYPSDRQLGFGPPPVDTNRLRQNIVRTLRIFQASNHIPGLTGKVSTVSQAKHMRLNFEAALHQTDSGFGAGEIELALGDYGRRYSLIELRETAKTLRLASQFLRPLYVGMASDRSLQERLRDHLADRSGLAERLKLYRLAWADTQYYYIPLPQEKSTIASAESVIQSLIFPSLSVR